MNHVSEDEVVNAAVSTTFAKEMTDGAIAAARACTESGMSAEDAGHAVVIGLQTAVCEFIKRVWGKDDDAQELAHKLVDLCWEISVPDTDPVEH